MNDAMNKDQEHARYVRNRYKFSKDDISFKDSLPEVDEETIEIMKLLEVSVKSRLLYKRKRTEVLDRKKPLLMTVDDLNELLGRS